VKSAVGASRCRSPSEAAPPQLDRRAPHGSSACCQPDETFAIPIVIVVCGTGWPVQAGRGSPILSAA